MASSAGQRVLDRLSLATDERLVTIVQGLLPAVLAEINGNPDPALLKTISHATTRLRGLPEARLPCDAIFSACARGGTARALGLVLLELGLPREEPAAKTALATRLVLEIASCGDVWSPQRATAVHLLLSVLPHATGDALTDAAAAHPDAAADLQDFLLDVLLATPGVSAGRVPPGLSAQRVGRLTARPATDWTLAALAPRKLAALSLLRRVSPPRDQVGALLAATCDAHYSVTDVATVALKALAESAADLNLDNDAGLTGNLLCLVLGAAKCPAGSADAARGRTAVSATFAQRAVRFAVENCKGATSGPVAMLALRVVLACAASETPALAATGASLAAFLAAHAPEAALPVLGPLLLRTAPVNPPTGPAAAPTTPAEDDKRHGGYVERGRRPVIRRLPLLPLPPPYSLPLLPLPPPYSYLTNRLTPQVPAHRHARAAQPEARGGRGRARAGPVPGRRHGDAGAAAAGVRDTRSRAGRGRARSAPARRRRRHARGASPGAVAGGTQQRPRAAGGCRVGGRAALRRHGRRGGLCVRGAVWRRHLVRARGSGRGPRRRRGTVGAAVVRGRHRHVPVRAGHSRHRGARLCLARRRYVQCRGARCRPA